VSGRRSLSFTVALSALPILAAPACHRARGGCGPGPPIVLLAPSAPVGFDAPFIVEAQPQCAEARAGTISWRQISGPPAPPLTASDGGFSLRGRTPTLAQSLGGTPPWGVVPLSPRTQGEIILEATFRDGRGHEERHQARVLAAARARGLPNLALNTRVYLGGAGWRLEARPPGSTAALEGGSGTASLLPDVAGDWRLIDGAGRPLTLRSARYDETPLDCGRAGCHTALVTASAGSRMATVLARGLSPALDGEGALFGAGYPDCAVACHATGEPGVADGGFAHVMSEQGLTSPSGRRWEAVPRALRRLGGVGCLACHGPGALPEASARWSVLRADVCATCHDAPPRYGHAAAWRTTAMARADRQPRAARTPACARCHTTWGFLATLDPEAAKVDRRPPSEVGPVGITCAACHAVHDHTGGGAAPPLLRPTRRPALLADVALPASAAKSLICLTCHTPEVGDAGAEGDGIPTASAAALWLGRGGLDPATGAALNGPAAHAAVAGGCIACHRAGPTTVDHGAGHAFAVDHAACPSCHTRGLPPTEDLRARAQGLWRAQALADVRQQQAPVADHDDRPPHARAARLDRATPLGRAAWNVALVLEDPAAAAHNAPYARLLLVAAEQTLNANPAPAAQGGRP
jgi:hypothetical protein